MKLSILLCLALVACVLGYSENLSLRPLSQKYLHASFEFEAESEPFNTHPVAHHDEFPRILSQIITQSDAREIHLRFAQGFWDAEEWGVL
ncbi:GPI transamidase component PIG-T, partial [Yarrowia lipolytica]